MMVHLSSCMHFLEGDANIILPWSGSVVSSGFSAYPYLYLRLLKFFIITQESLGIFIVLGKVDVLKTEGRDGQIEIFIALIP